MVDPCDDFPLCAVACINRCNDIVAIVPKKSNKTVCRLYSFLQQNIAPRGFSAYDAGIRNQFTKLLATFAVFFNHSDTDSVFFQNSRQINGRSATACNHHIFYRAFVGSCSHEKLSQLFGYSCDTEHISALYSKVTFWYNRFPISFRETHKHFCSDDFLQIPQGYTIKHSSRCNAVLNDFKASF